MRLALVPLALCLLGAPASAARDDVDLRNARTRLLGAGEVGGAGDFDGDGRIDLVLSKSEADPYGRRDAGAAYVWTGGAARARVTSRDFVGFRIAGARSRDNLYSSCVAGDLNDDGLADLVIGAQTADTANGAASGAAYAVFGSTTRDDVDLRDFHENSQGPAGFRIDGPSGFALAGARVGCPGDIDGDGTPDVAVAAPFAGATYVVFGKGGSDPVDLARFDLNAQGAAGYRIDTPGPEYSNGYTVSGAGDVNGDGLNDVVVGVIPDEFDSPGRAYVVYGKTDPLPVDVSADGNAWGYRIEGEADGFATGAAVSEAGDVNGDGLDDVAIGAHRVYRNLPGKAYVVYGSSAGTDVDLQDLGARGFEIVGGPGRDDAGNALAAAGDVDRDGFGDLLVGAPWTDTRERTGAGAVYLIFGNARSETVRLATLGDRGYRIIGEKGDHQVGASVEAFRRNGTRALIGSWYSKRAYVVPLRSDSG